MKKEFFKMAIKNLKNRRLRSSLTLLGIVISIATLFVLISLSLGLQDSVEEQFSLLGTDKFFIQPKGQMAGPGSGGAVLMTEKDAGFIKKIPGVKEVSFWVIGNAKIEFNGETRFVQVSGTDLITIDLFVETGSYKIEDGRFLKKGDEKNIMIGSQYKHNNFFKNPVEVGDNILINGIEYNVKGILDPLGNPSDDKLIHMPLKEFRSLFNMPVKLDGMVVQIEDGLDVKEVAFMVDKKLMKFRNVNEKTSDFSILTPEEVLEIFGVILSVLTGFLVSIGGISLIVGGIGIANTMYTSVLERTKEIGVMKSIGAKQKDILSIFLIESGLLGLIGGIIGVVFGIIFVKTIEYITVNKLGVGFLQISISLNLVIGSLLFSFIIGSISGFWPAYKATKIKPVDALRYD